MIEKQFKVTNISKDGNTGLFLLGKDNLSVYDVVRLLNELNDENKKLKQQLNKLNKEKKELKEILELVSRADSFIKEESVKEILRNKIRGLDTVSYEFAGAWHDYCILSNFFKKQYGEHWDNE